MGRYRSFIFDLYGTLVDIRTDEHSPSLWRRAAEYFRAHGAAYSAKELREAYLALCGRAQRSSPDPLYELELSEVFADLYCQKNVVPDGRLVAETALLFRIASTRKLRLYPWTLPAIKLIRSHGAGVYLLSNAQSCFTVPELRALGLDDAFDGMVLSSEAGVRKPSPDIMLRLLSENGLEPSSSIMIGNDRRSDVAAAHAVGMDAVYIETETSGGFDPAFIAEYELTDGRARELPKLILTLLEAPDASL